MDITLTINPIQSYKKAATIKDDCGFAILCCWFVLVWFKTTLDIK
jgi:hypothetical protein